MARFKWRRILAISALCLGTAGTGYAANIWMTNNFGTVVAGEVYRSAQPGEAQLAAYKKAYGVRTVINLRGENETASWYRTEKDASRKLGLIHIDFGMRSSKALSPGEAKRLVQIMESAEKPLLIHCKAGADRTGLASALYLAAIAKVGDRTAEQQLSIRYGHFSLPYISSAYPMDESFEHLEGALDLKKS